jgi:hypothetical protein
MLLKAGDGIGEDSTEQRDDSVLQGDEWREKLFWKNNFLGNLHVVSRSHLQGLGG